MMKGYPAKEAPAIVQFADKGGGFEGLKRWLGGVCSGIGDYEVSKNNIYIGRAMMVGNSDGATAWRDVFVVTRSSRAGGSPDGSLSGRSRVALSSALYKVVIIISRHTINYKLDAGFINMLVVVSLCRGRRISSLFSSSLSCHADANHPKGLWVRSAWLYASMLFLKSES